MIRRSTDNIVLHCAATPPSADIGVNEIRQWHRAKGWTDCGYHYVIRRDGRVEPGRPENLVGSHVKNHNAKTLGVCMVGGVDAQQRPQDNFTPQQWASLQTLLMRLTGRYPLATILGHRDFPGVHKACPCFDAIDWATDMGLPAARRLQPVKASLFMDMGRPEIEDDDEADPDEMMEGDGTPRTSPGKWGVAAGGSGAFGTTIAYVLGDRLATTLGYTLTWQGMAVIGGLFVVVTIALFIAMGAEKRERIWSRLFERIMGWLS